MKKLLNGFVFLVGMLSFCSCTKLIYSNQQVMQSYHTKEQVIKQFGHADEIKESGGITEWVYSCDTTSALMRSKTKVTVNGVYHPVAGVSKDSSLKVEQFTTFAKYVRFSFDAQGNVLRYDMHDITFIDKKKKTFATIALITGGALVLATLIGGAITTSALSDWHL